MIVKCQFFFLETMAPSVIFETKSVAYQVAYCYQVARYMLQAAHTMLHAALIPLEQDGQLLHLNAAVT